MLRDVKPVLVGLFSLGGYYLIVMAVSAAAGMVLTLAVLKLARVI